MIHDTNKYNVPHSVAAGDVPTLPSHDKPVHSSQCKALVDSAVAMTEQVVRDGTVRNPTEVRTLVNYLLG